MCSVDFVMKGRDEVVAVLVIPGVDYYIYMKPFFQP